MCSEDRAGDTGAMFLFFSNRMGCLGSLLFSAAISFIILAVCTPTFR